MSGNAQSSLASLLADVANLLPDTQLQSLCFRLKQKGGRAEDAMNSIGHLIAGPARIALDQAFRCFPELTAETAACSLEAASAALSLGRQQPDAQLVWTGPGATNGEARDTLPQMLELIGRARTSILLVTFAAFKARALMTALLAAHQRGVKLTIVVETAKDSEGQLSFDAARAFPSELIAHGSLWYWPLEKRPRNGAGAPAKLHAKCLVIDGREVLFSSANLTDDALERNIEVGVRLSCGAVPSQLLQHFLSLIESGDLKGISAGN